MLSADIREGMRILELGCGTGYFTRELARTGAMIDAVDISPELLAVARKHCPTVNVTFQIQNAYALEYEDSVFDAVVGSSVLHHLAIEQALTQIYRVLRPRGTICFTEPNMLNPQIAIQKNVPAVKRRLGDSPDESAFFRWALRRQLERADFARIQIRPFDFLHPQTPSRLIPLIRTAGDWCERIPLISEIAGSLYIKAVK
jgi:ubiquinone/menaquinone biosynthesis C-methylase UbiE